jgi:hypothetical protein
MRAYLTLLVLTAAASFALAQDPGMMAAQQAAQIAQQATQQANDQMNQAAQQANQTMMQNAQQAAQSTPACNRCVAAKPKFSAKSGAYSAALTVKMKDSTRGAVIYYTTDGWTPTASSTRYVGPITIASTTSLQAVAISRHGGRSRVATALYTINALTSIGVSSTGATSIGVTTNGAPPTAPAVQSAVAVAVPNAALESIPAYSKSAKLLLARGTAVPFVFASDVTSKTAEVGDKIPLTLAEDLKAGNVVLVKKGTPAAATVTEVDKPGMGGLPGEVFFQVDSLKAGTLIKLHGGAAKEGQDKEREAVGLMFIPGAPVGVFVRGTNAEIKQGAVFTAFVDADTLLPPAN